jgi:hypothetical protein
MMPTPSKDKLPRAQVLGDRSNFLHDLHRDLAVKRLQTNAVASDAATAGTASILNRENLERFGDWKEVPTTNKGLSEGTLHMGMGETTSKKRIGAVPSPETLPRPAKKLRPEKATTLFSSPDKSLLNESLQTEGRLLPSKEKKVEELETLVQTQESELSAVQHTNTRLESRLESLGKKSKQELSDRRELEETVDALVDTKLSLEKELIQEKVEREEERKQWHAERLRLKQHIRALV